MSEAYTEAEEAIRHPRFNPHRIVGIVNHIKWLRTRESYQQSDETPHIDDMIKLADEYMTWRDGK